MTDETKYGKGLEEGAAYKPYAHGHDVVPVSQNYPGMTDEMNARYARGIAADAVLNPEEVAFEASHGGENPERGEKAVEALEGHLYDQTTLSEEEVTAYLEANPRDNDSLWNDLDDLGVSADDGVIDDWSDEQYVLAAKWAEADAQTEEHVPAPQFLVEYFGLSQETDETPSPSADAKNAEAETIKTGTYGENVDGPFESNPDENPGGGEEITEKLGDDSYPVSREGEDVLAKEGNEHKPGTQTGTEPTEDSVKDLAPASAAALEPASSNIPEIEQIDPNAGSTPITDGDGTDPVEPVVAPQHDHSDNPETPEIVEGDGEHGTVHVRTRTRPEPTEGTE